MVDHVETVDLFYHTTQLGYHEESAKGFSEWICKILKNWDSYKNNHHCYYIVEKMAGLPVAATIMNWYTGRNCERNEYYYPCFRMNDSYGSLIDFRPFAVDSSVSNFYV